MNIEPYKNGFYRVTNAPPRISSYLQHQVKPELRFYQDGAWYVHESEIETIKQPPRQSKIARPLAPTTEMDYHTLYLLPTAPDEVVDAVWKRLAAVHHPDKGGDAAAFKQILSAYQRIKGAREK